MFASILRRWRLVTPLGVVALLSLVISMSVLTPASAHKLNFAFAGDFAGMIDLQVNPPHIECFSGQLESDTADINSVVLQGGGCVDETLDSIDGNAIAHADVVEASIKSNHTNHEGHVITDVIVFGETAIFGPAGSLRIAESAATNKVAAVACADNGITEPITLDGAFCAGGVLVTAGDFVHTTAEAECEKRDKHFNAHASVKGTTSFDDLDMAFQNGPNGTQNLTRELHPGPFLLAGGSVQFVTTALVGVRNPVTFAFTVVPATLVVIVNESVVQRSDDFASISLNGLHVIVQGGAGGILLNVIFAHAFAQIHCHKGHFQFEDAIGA